MIDDEYYWANDSYWTAALQTFSDLRDGGRTHLTLDLGRVERELFDGNSPAYRLLDAMASVTLHEGWDGCRGAPRLVLALLQRLSELSDG